VTRSGSDLALGFTLVELAIAVTIIVLLMVAVMQSESLIGSAGSKAAQAAVKDLTTAIGAFKDRYGYLPGDMPTATAQIPGLVAGSCSATDNGDGNGQIDAAEVACVPEHLFRAGFIKGGTGTITLSISGKPVTVRAIAASLSGAGAVYPYPSGTRNVIELLNLPCQAAQDLDAKSDDGNFTTGTTRANVASCTVGGANDPVTSLAVAL